jgi:hypothetical protein
MTTARASFTDAAATAADSFVFGYPLVLMDLVRARMTAVAEPDPILMRAPVNRFVHARELPAATAGTDTLRSSAWLDVGSGPVLLTVPETHGRFYVLALVDLWTNVFASVGARTTGTDGGVYAVTGPSWTGRPPPAGAFPINAPTCMVMVAGLTQVDGEVACAAAHAVQDAYGLTPLGGANEAEQQTAKGAARPVSRTPPLVQVERMDAREFFTALSRLMRDNPPRLEDRPMVERMRRLGLLLEHATSWERLDRDVRRAAAFGTERGLERVRAAAEAPPGEVVGDWRLRFRRGQFGTDYVNRAGAACAGLETGPAADELPALVRTDGDGRPLTGRHRYLLRFPADELPPVHGFWTLTTYDDREDLVDNPVNRYSIGDWHGLTLDRDGSLSIRIQHSRPADTLSNWLPAPPGPFKLLLRLCWPQQEVLDRKWVPPPVTRAD